jgi:DNA mismatch repair protein MutS2
VKPDGLLDEASARALEFRWLRHALSPASAYGDRVFDRAKPFAPGQEREAHARAQRIGAIAATASPAALDAMREVFRNVADAANAIARASMGDVLGDANMLELLRFFDACARLDALSEGVHALPRAASAAVRTCAQRFELGRAGKFGFYLADGFDPALAKARAALAKAQAEYDAVRGRAVASVAQVLGRDIASDEFIVMRGDLTGPLPPGVRVVREAPTYVLCEIDVDEATLAALERRDSIANAVAAAEESARRSLTEIVRAHASELDAAAEAFGEADVLVAAARFTQAHGCEVATIVAEPAFRFRDGCFSPLAIQLEKEGRSFTKISVDLDGVAVLTGPNMGGKSVCLRTCGFIAMCAAFGVPVPASDATTALFFEIAWLGVGAGEEGGGLLSSFAQEVVRLRDVLERGRMPLFVLLDEFARTTTPREGKALLVAVLQRFTALRARGLAATHLAGVAGDVAVRHFAVRGLRGIPERPATTDLHEALETLAASMDYTIEEVTDESVTRSDAIALAALLGLDETVIASAYEAMG